jgi:hypothetical protein
MFMNLLFNQFFPFNLKIKILYIMFSWMLKGMAKEYDWIKNEIKLSCHV